MLEQVPREFPPDSPVISLQHPHPCSHIESHLLTTKYLKLQDTNITEGEYLEGEKTGIWTVYTLSTEPTVTKYTKQRVGATCRDGSRSTATGRGACSWHGGVMNWLYNTVGITVREEKSLDQKISETRKQVAKMLNIDNPDTPESLHRILLSTVWMVKALHIYSKALKGKIEDEQLLKAGLLQLESRNSESTSEHQRRERQLRERIIELEAKGEQLERKLEDLRLREQNLKMQLEKAEEQKKTQKENEKKERQKFQMYVMKKEKMELKFEQMDYNGCNDLQKYQTKIAKKEEEIKQDIPDREDQSNDVQDEKSWESEKSFKGYCENQLESSKRDKLSISPLINEESSTRYHSFSDTKDQNQDDKRDEE